MIRRFVRPWQLLIMMLLVTGCGSRPAQVPLTSDQAVAALLAATTKVEAPYVLGGRGPDVFDCSGLITWSYRGVAPGLNLYLGGGKLAPDATIEELYRWNILRLSPQNVFPGDLVFITDGSDVVTHGGLVVALSSETVRFINASSYYGKVVIDEWPVAAKVRGQSIVGYGRLLTSL